MEKLEDILLEWQELEPTLVAFSKIKTDVGLQPRTDTLVPARHRGRTEEASQEHVTRMRGVLEARKEAQLEPLLIADIEGTLYVVDGHHRLKAYKLARRRTVPARVRRLTFPQATLLSKLVNVGGARLPLHAEQARDAAWQYLAAVTHRGTVPLPLGESTRTVGARFGISHETVASMLRRLPKVVLGEYGQQARDPGTDWPRWRYVKQNCHWIGDLMPAQARLRRRAEQVAKHLGKLLDRVGPEALHMGFEIFLGRDVDADLVERFEETRRKGAEMASEEEAVEAFERCQESLTTG